MAPSVPIFPCPYLCPKCSKNPEIYTFNSDCTEYHCVCSTNLVVPDANLTFSIQCQKNGFKEIELYLDNKQEYLHYNWIKHVGWQIAINNDYNHSFEILGEGSDCFTPDEAWNLLLKFNKLLAFS
jgi:hypothetical protein